MLHPKMIPKPCSVPLVDSLEHCFSFSAGAEQNPISSAPCSPSITSPPSSPSASSADTFPQSQQGLFSLSEIKHVNSIQRSQSLNLSSRHLPSETNTNCLAEKVQQFSSLFYEKSASSKIHLENQFNNPVSVDSSANLDTFTEISIRKHAKFADLKISTNGIAKPAPLIISTQEVPVANSVQKPLATEPFQINSKLRSLLLCNNSTSDDQKFCIAINKGFPASNTDANLTCSTNKVSAPNSGKSNCSTSKISSPSVGGKSNCSTKKVSSPTGGKSTCSQSVGGKSARPCSKTLPLPANGQSVPATPFSKCKAPCPSIGKACAPYSP